MAALGDIIGALMIGIIRARRMADEQTAVLAEYYKTNPVLEGLSVPRVRIPQFTVDMPFVIDDQTVPDSGTIQSPARIASIAAQQLKLSLTRNNVRASSDFSRIFAQGIRSRLSTLRGSTGPIMRETIVRNVLDAFAAALSSSKTMLSMSERDAIAGDLRRKIWKEGVTREPVGPGLTVTVRTAEVKEQASAPTVVRLSLTMKEEGLEWATQAGENGGVVQTLQPE